MKTRIIGATALCVAFVASGAFAQDFCNASHSGSKKTVSFSVGAGSDKGETGDIGQYHYEQWNKSGSATTDFYDDGSFSCSFSNTDDFLCREGLFYGQNSGKDPLSVGNLVADYSMKTFTNDKSISYAYAGIYGWMQNPLIEWYIVDNWGPASRPNWLGTSRGKITVDGAEYEIFTASANRATIEGNKAFDQIYSLRSTARTCGTISITEHFKAWKEKGITLGSSLYEAKVLGEAGQYPEQQGASGKIDFVYAKVYVQNDQPKSSSSVESSSSVLMSSSPTLSSSSQRMSSSPTLSSSSQRMSSSPTLSSSNIESSSSTISLPAAFRISNADRNLWVFDMQGRVLGQVFVPAGTGINSAILAKFGKAGVYMVKVDGALKAFSVAK
jgi:endo-1,4-beta-xylanase